MRYVLDRLICSITGAFVCLALTACGTNPQASGPMTSSESQNQNQAQNQNRNQSPIEAQSKQQQNQTDIAKQQRDTEQRTRPDIEQRRQQEQQEAEKNLDREAMDAISETQTAVKALTGGNSKDALSAIERATGKINILLARYPAAALIPIAAEVDVIDLAPHNLELIKAATDTVDGAVSEKDYPSARLVLDGLTSEIRIRTTNLPLSRYPDALRQAARFLDQQKNQEATAVLMDALNTLVIVERADPLPVMVAQKDVDQALNLRDKNKEEAARLLSDAQTQLERAKALGYSANDPEYTALNKAISDLQKQLKGNGETLQAFSNLKDKLAAFFKRQSERLRRSRQG
jgi:hypothetical protein